MFLTKNKKTRRLSTCRKARFFCALKAILLQWVFRRLQLQQRLR